MKGMIPIELVIIISILVGLSILLALWDRISPVLAITRPFSFVSGLLLPKMLNKVAVKKKKGIVLTTTLLASIVLVVVVVFVLFLVFASLSGESGPSSGSLFYNFFDAIIKSLPWVS